MGAFVKNAPISVSINISTRCEAVLKVDKAFEWNPKMYVYTSRGDIRVK